MEKPANEGKGLKSFVCVCVDGSVVCKCDEGVKGIGSMGRAGSSATQAH